MAGLKETPRQKMIGMMYLVLTALLALNVDNAILQKFLLINNSISAAVKESSDRNRKTVDGIQEAVKERGGKAKEIGILNTAKDVRKKTTEMMAYINDLKKSLIDLTGEDENGNPANPGEINDVQGYMLGTGKKGKAYELKKELDAYTKYLSGISGSQVPSLTKEAKEIDVYKTDKAQRNKDFAELNFQETPVAAALALLSEKQGEVVKREALVLNDLAAKVGARDFKFDKLNAMYSADANIVAAGTKYSAKMFISATSSGVTPTMTFNGSPVAEIDANGVGTIEFTASGGGYDANGIAKKSWKGAITIDNPEDPGSDTTFVVEGEYMVAKPVIQVQSASVQALYLNCGNEMLFNVPALGPLYNPNFSVSGGLHVKGAKRGAVVIYPKSPEVAVTVSSGGNVIGTEKFEVKRVPRPQIRIYSGGKEIDQKRGMNAPGPRGLSVRAIADPAFKEFLPKEANYRISSCDVILARGKRAVVRKSFSGGDINMGSIAAQAQSGDRIIVDVKGVQRKNSKGEIETVPMGGSIMATVQLN